MKRRILCIALFFMGFRAVVPAQADPAVPTTATTVHVFVALCDNRQGIAPVPPAIGNGDDPARNLYWGCDEGIQSYFGRSDKWMLVETRKNPAPGILERLVFRHRASGTLLVADGYRGLAIRQCLTEFLAATAGRFECPIEVDGQKRDFGGKADLIAYIGHNGLYQYEIEVPKPAPGERQVAVLCCRSTFHFSDELQAARARPLLMTDDYMYPGAFILHDVIEGWMAGEGRPALRERAAKAYARNQEISVKAARTVFTALE